MTANRSLPAARLKNIQDDVPADSEIGNDEGVFYNDSGVLKVRANINGALTTFIAAAAQGEAVTAAVEDHALNSTFSDVEAETALNALGVAVNAIIARLVAVGIIAVEA
jgi:hypothetical protein